MKKKMWKNKNTFSLANICKKMYSVIVDLFFSKNYVLYFTIIIFTGIIIDNDLTNHVRIISPVNFYLYEQNEIVKKCIGTEHWYIPTIISLFYSLLLIFLTMKSKNIVFRIGLLYFGLFTYVYSLSWILNIRLIEYYNLFSGFFIISITIMSLLFDRRLWYQICIPCRIIH